MIAALAVRLGVLPSQLLAEDELMLQTMIDILLTEEEGT